MKIKKCIPMICAVIAVSSAAVGLNSLNAQAVTGTDWATGFVMDGASVRTEAPAGIRFHTQVNVGATEKDKYSFGTLIIPQSELDGKTAEEYLTYANANNDDVLNIPTTAWQEGEAEYTSVLGGVENGGNIANYPAAKYNEPIVARSYAVNKTNTADVKYTAVETRTLAQVASIALAATPDPEKPLSDDAKTYLNGVVNSVLGDDNFALTAKTVTDKTPVDITTLFSESNGSEGLTAKWSVVEGDSVTLAYDENGIATTFTAVKAGDTKLKAEIGADSAEVTISVEDETPMAVTNVTYDSENGKIAWTASENADSYNVTVEKWNDGSKSTYTTETNEYAIELTGGVYNVSVSGVSTFGTVGAAGTTEYASYTPANASAANVFFDFEDTNAIDVVKPSTWKAWSSAPSEQSVLSIAEQTDDNNALKIENQNTAFAGVAIKLPFAIPVVDIQSITMDYYVAYNFNVILSDGTNQMRLNYNPGTSAWKNAQLPISDFTTFTTVAPTEITEIYLVKHNNSGDYYFDNIGIISYAQTAENEYVLANFDTEVYKPYLSVKGSTTYTIANGYMDIQHADKWGNADVRYKLPTALSGDAVQSVTFYVKGKSTSTLNFRFYDENGTIIKAVTANAGASGGITLSGRAGWQGVTYTLPADFAEKTIAYIGFAASEVVYGNDGYIWQADEVTYTKKA